MGLNFSGLSIASSLRQQKKKSTNRIGLANRRKKIGQGGFAGAFGSARKKMQIVNKSKKQAMLASKKRQGGMGFGQAAIGGAVAQKKQGGMMSAFNNRKRKKKVLAASSKNAIRSMMGGNAAVTRKVAQQRIANKPRVSVQQRMQRQRSSGMGR